MAGLKQPKGAVAQGSDEVLEIFCEICLNEGKRSTATAFCVDCAGYFCKVCLKYHTTFLKGHNTLDEDAMPKDVERCPVHGGLIRLYCETCEKFICNACKTSHTSSSKKHCKLTPVSELSKNIEQSQELKDFITIMDKSLSKSARMKRMSKQLEKVHSKALHAVQGLQQSFLEKADKMKKDIEQRNQNDSKFRQTLQNKSSVLAAKMEVLTNKIKQRQKNIGTQKMDMFIAMKQMKPEIEALDKEMDEINTAIDNLFYTFEPDKGLQCVTDTTQTIGTLKSQPERSSTNQKKIAKRKTAVFQYDIKKEITDMVVENFCELPGQLLAVCDSQDNSVKLINTGDKRIVSTLYFKTIPTAITCVENTQFACAQQSLSSETTSIVTFIDIVPVWGSGKNLQFKGNHFKLGMECKEIIYDKGRFIVLLCPANYGECKVQILDMSGAVLETFYSKQLNKAGPAWFSSLTWLALDKTSNLLYATNLLNDQLTRIKFDITASKEEREMQYFLLAPTGIAADDHGCVYASLHGHNKIKYINTNTGESQDVITEKDGIIAPNTIKYCKEDQMLYVEASGSIKVFKIVEQDCVWKETLEMVGKWEPI